MRTMAPPLEFDPFIDSYWFLEGDSVLDLNGGVELVFNLGAPLTVCLEGRNPVRVSGHFIFGGLARRVGFRSCGELKLFGVRFRPCGIFPYLSMPQMEFAGQCVALEELWELMGIGAASVVRDKGQGPTHYADNFSGFFSSRIKSFDTHSRTVVSAVSAIRQAAGDLSVESLAAECGVSRRHLERLFDLRIGVTPKHLARMFRLSHALNNLSSLGSADTAAHCGFFDQSHLIRDSQLLADHSPARLGR